MLTVAHHLLDAELSGGQVFALTLGRSLAEIGVRSVFVVPRPGPLVPLLEADGFAWDIAGADRPIALASQLRRAVGSHRADLLHSHVVLPGQLAGRLAGLLGRFPVVTHYHLVPPVPAGPRGYVYRMIDVLGANTLSRRNLAVSEHVGATLRRTGMRRLDVVPNGVPLPADQHRAHEDDGSAVLMVGRLARGKAHDVMIEAMARLPEPFRLLILGSALNAEDDVFAAALRARTSELGLEARVTFEPASSEAPERAMRDASMLVLCSRSSEGMPLVVLEAMARRLPVVATRVAGSTELVDDGVTGLLVDPDDVDGLVDAVSRLGRDAALRAELGSAGRERVVRRHDIDAVARACAAAYRRALGESHIHP